MLGDRGKGNMKKTIAIASVNGDIVLHKRCRKEWIEKNRDLPSKDGDFLGVFIHDIRSEYIGRFQCCSNCGKAIME